MWSYNIIILYIQMVLISINNIYTNNFNDLETVKKNWINAFFLHVSLDIIYC